MNPLAILATGMVTGVGLDAPSTCAAIRCAYDNFQETRFMDKGGEWIMGCEVPLEGKLRGRDKLLALASLAIRECMAGLGETSAPQPFQAPPRPITADQIPLLLCVAEEDRPGRLADLGEGFLLDLQGQLGQRFHRASCLISKGRVGGIEALRQARELLKTPEIPRVVIVGVDSYLEPKGLQAFETRSRLKTSENSDGFIPGEAAGGLLLARPSELAGKPGLLCLGIGEGHELAPIESGQPFRADGLVQAVQAMLKDAGLSMADMDFRIADLNGESYGFKEATLAVSRTLRTLKDSFDIWHPADCFGEIGAAFVPCLVSQALFACAKGYAPGPTVLCHCANDAGDRAAAVLRYH